MSKRLVLLLSVIIISTNLTYAQRSRKKIKKAVKVETVAQPQPEVVEVTPPPAPVVPHDRLDTIYYDSQWKVVSNKVFASFYRYALYPVDKEAMKRCKTFYVSGEPEGEGCFISLSKDDDAQSEFIGKYTKYYKNGKIEQECNYADGKMEGEYTTYYENGLIKEHAFMKTGRRNGIVTTFSENGLICKQSDYIADEQGSTYLVTDKQGNYTIYNTATGKPAFATPSTNDMKMEYKNGVAWPYYNLNGQVLGVSEMIDDINDNYRKYSVFLSNNSMENIDIDPAYISIFFVKKGESRMAEVMPYDKYMKEVYKNEKHDAKRIAKNKAVVKKQSQNNLNNALGATMFSDADNTTNDFQQRMIKKTTLDGNLPVLADNQATDMGYLQRTTVHPGETVYGFLLTDNKKMDELRVDILVNGIKYQYSWDLSKKK